MRLTDIYCSRNTQCLLQFKPFQQLKIMTRWAHHTPIQRNWLFNFYLLRNLSWKQKVSTESINTYLVQISLLLIPVPDFKYLFLLQVWKRELIFVEYVKCATNVQIHPNWLLHHEDAVISAKYGHLVEQIVLDLWEYKNAFSSAT